MLEVSFKSFSKIALTGFLEDIENKKKVKMDLISNYEAVINSLRAFTFFLQLLLFSYSYYVLIRIGNKNSFALIFLILLFLTLFDFLLYSFAFFFKEKILDKLLPLQIIPWYFFYPANFIFSNFVKKRISNRESDADDLSEREMEVFIEEGRKDGIIEKEDREMIESVLEFGDTLVKEIMTPRVDMQYIEKDIEIDELVNFVNKTKKSRYPVISGRVDNIIGIILTKDIFKYWKNEEFQLKNILRDPYFIPETMRILELLKDMQKLKQKFAIVVDEFGGVSGVVTMEDLIEEIVGEIQDEYDEDIDRIIMENGTYLVKGDTDISELGDALALKIEEEDDFQTVSGLINFKLGKIPKKNEEVVIGNLVFKVVEIENNRINKVKISRDEKKNS